MKKTQASPKYFIFLHQTKISYLYCGGKDLGNTYIFNNIAYVRQNSDAISVEHRASISKRHGHLGFHRAALPLQQVMKLRVNHSLFFFTWRRRKRRHKEFFSV
jgi:hypothetical protein